MKYVIGLLLLTISCLHGDASYWDSDMVRSYVHYSDLQRRWAWSFLAPYLKEIKADAKILDIGCGDGKITADISKFIPNGSILGIDLSSSMLDWAKKQYNPREHPNLSFQEGSFLEMGVLDQFDLVVSFCALQHCTDQKSAFLEISKVLKPNGKVLILVPAMNNRAWNQARTKVQAAPKWAPYWEGFTPRKFLNVNQYKDLLTETGFHILKIDNIQTMDPFIDEDEILDWLEGRFPPIIPKDQAPEFYREWIKEYLQLDPESIDKNGVIYARLEFLVIEAISNRQ